LIWGCIEKNLISVCLSIDLGLCCWPEVGLFKTRFRRAIKDDHCKYFSIFACILFAGQGGAMLFGIIMLLPPKGCALLVADPWVDDELVSEYNLTAKSCKAAVTSRWKPRIMMFCLLMSSLTVAMLV